MNKRFLRSIALILSVLMLIGAMPINAFSAGNAADENGASKEFGLQTAAYDDVQAYAFLYNDGELVLEGDNSPDESEKSVVTSWEVGDIYYAANSAAWPWYSSAGAIKKVRFAINYQPQTTAYMFYNCTALEEFDGANLDMSNSINAQSMFYLCSGLKTVKNIEQWNMNKMRDVRFMFYYCSGLTELNLSQWDFGGTNNINMNSMFYNCTNLKTVGDISGWNTAQPSTMDSMFSNCSKLESLNFTGWYNSNSINKIFDGCDSLVMLTLGENFKFPSSGNDGLTGTWYLNGTGKELSAGEVRTNHNNAAATETYYKYYQHYIARLYEDGRLVISKDTTPASDEEVVEATWDSVPIKGIEGAESWPWNDKRNEIKAVSFSDLYSSVSTAFMFSGCASLASFDGDKMDMLLATDMNHMFSGCSALSNITGAEKWNIGNVVNMRSLFEGCKSLSAAPVFSGWNTENVTNMSNLFKDCAVLTEISGINNWNIENVTDISGIFENCSLLHTLDLSGWSTLGNPTMKNAFSGCTGLENLHLGQNFRFSDSNDDGLSGVWKLDGGDGKQLNAGQLKALHNSNARSETYVSDKPFYAYIDANGTLFIHQNKNNLPGNLIMEPVQMPTEIDEKSDWPWDAYRGNIRDADLSPSYYPTTMAYMFADCNRLGDAADGEVRLVLDTRYVTDMSHMFEKCSNLSSNFDLSALQTENITNMDSMFAGCSGITSLYYIGLNTWNTGSVETMRNLFGGCSSLTDISALREWKISSVKDISGLFEGCASLSDATAVNKWDIGNITDMSNLFKDCSALAMLDAGNWNSHTVKMSGMLSGCTAVKEMTLGPDFIITDDAGLTGLWQLNGEGDILESDQVRENHENAKKAETYKKPFYGVLYEDGAFVIQRGDAADKNIHSVKSAAFLIPLSKIADAEDSADETEPNTEDWLWKESADKIRSVAFSEHFQPTNTAEMFAGCTNLTSFNGENFATWDITDMHGMFEGCASLQLLDVSGWNTGAVTDMSNMFSGCTSLQGITGLKFFNTVSVTNMSGMFKDCSSLVDLDLSNFNSASMASITDMFSGCTGVKRIVLGKNFRMKDDSGLPGEWYLDGVGEKMNAAAVKQNHQNSNKTDSYFTDYGFYAILYENGELVFQIGTTPEPGRNKKKIWSLASEINGKSDVPWHSHRDEIKAVTFRDKVAPETTAYWFADCTNLETVANSSENLNTQNVTDMQSMFQDCTKLSALDVEHWDTKKVTSLSHAFENSGIVSLNASFWVLNSCTDVSHMFANCAALKDVAAEFWGMENVLDMRNMFQNCAELYSVDITEWNTVKAEDMSNLFKGCGKLGTLAYKINLSALDTDSATDMSSAFEGTAFKIIDLSACNTANVKNFSRIFADCKQLKSLNISGWSTQAANTMDDMFLNLERLESITLGDEFIFLKNKPQGLTNSWKRMSDGHVMRAEKLAELSGKELAGEFRLMTDAYALLYPNGELVVQIGDEADTKKGEPQIWPMPKTVSNSAEWPWNGNRAEITSVRFADKVSIDNAGWMFSGCASLRSFDGANLDVSAVTDMSYMFYDCSALTQLSGLEGWNTEKVRNMSSMFWMCSELADLSESGITNWNVGSAEDMSSMFQESGLQSIDLSPWHTGSLVNISFMFSSCTALESVDLSGWDTKNVNNMCGVFNEDSALTGVAGLSDWLTRNAANMSWMFYNCVKLKSVDHGIGKWNTAQVTDMMFMFAESGITDADLGEWNTGNVTTMESIFSGCSALTSIDTEKWNTLSASNSEDGLRDMFFGTSALKEIKLGRNFRFSGGASEGLTGGWKKKGDSENGAIPYNQLMKSYDGALMAGIYLREDVCGILYDNGDLVIQYGNEPEEGRSKIQEYQIGNIENYEEWPWYEGKDEIRNVSFKDNIHFDYIGYMFYGCETLESFNGTNLDTSDVYYASGMFLGCPNLKNLEGLETWNTESFVETDDMFSGCTALTSIDGIGDWNTDWLELTSGMFADCGVRSLDLSKWKMGSVTDMSAMFSGCFALEYLNISGLTPAEETDMNAMFRGCAELGRLVLGEHFKIGTGDPELTGGWKYLGEGDIGEQTGEDLLKNFDGSYPGEYAEINHINFGYAVLYNDGTLEFRTGAPKSDDGVLNSGKLNADGAISISNVINNKDSIKKIVFEEGFASAATITPWVNVSGLFAGLINLTSADFTNADLSKVTDMRNLFNGCSALETVTALKSGMLTDLSAAFKNCSSLQAIDLSGLATSDTAAMAEMFTGCTPAGITLGESFIGKAGSGLTGNYKNSTNPNGAAVDGETLISTYDGTAPGTYVRVDAMNYGYAALYDDGRLVFLANPEQSEGASKAGYLEISGDTVNATTLSSLMASFVGEEKTTIKSVSFEKGYNSVPGFCPWTSLYQLFNGFTGLQSVSFQNADLSKVTNAGGNGKTVTSNANSAFNGCTSLETIDFTGCDLSSATDMRNMFNIGPASTIKTVIFKDCNLSAVKTMQYMFKNCKQMASADFTNCDISSVTDVSYMFRECTNLESIDLGNDLSNVTTATYMFYNCNKLTEVAPFVLSSKVTTLSYMFTNCYALKQIDVSGFDTSNVTFMTNMFQNCSEFLSLDLSAFDMTKVESTQSMFEGCSKLAAITFSEKCKITKITIAYVGSLPDTGGLDGKWKREKDGKIVNADTCEFNNLTDDNDMAGTYHKQNVTGSLNISVDVSENGDSGKEWQFKVTLDGYDANTESGGLADLYGGVAFTDGVSDTFALKAGQSKSISNITAGLSYKVEELNADTDGYKTTATEEIGVIETGTTLEAAFYNEKEAVADSNLTVTNTVKGSMGDREKKFNFELSLSGDDGVYAEDIYYRKGEETSRIQSENGVYKFTLADGETITFIGLKGGLGYTVTEIEEDGYTVEKTDDTGTMNGEDISVSFINSKDIRIPTSAHTESLFILLPIAAVVLFLLIRKKRASKED